MTSVNELEYFELVVQRYDVRVEWVMDPRGLQVCIPFSSTFYSIASEGIPTQCQKEFVHCLDTLPGLTGSDFLRRVWQSAGSLLQVRFLLYWTGFDLTGSRDYTEKQASKLGLTGWVQNDSSGTVRQHSCTNIDH